MFGLFKKKEKSITVIDKIWMSERAKWDACLELLTQDSHTVLLAWFSDTKEKLETYLREHGQSTVPIYNADFYNSGSAGQQVIFVEHHPLQSEEQRKGTELGLGELIVFSSLDEPIFEVFGGQKVLDLMKKMGMNEQEVLQHDMISSSIKRAQEKIAEKSTLTGSARSQGDWLLNAGLGDRF